MGGQPFLAHTTCCYRIIRALPLFVLMVVFVEQRNPFFDEKRILIMDLATLRTPSQMGCQVGPLTSAQSTGIHQRGELPISLMIMTHLIFRQHDYLYLALCTN